MLTYGIVKNQETKTDNTRWLQIRIPSIHGADSQKQYDGQMIRNYVLDADLPWYQSVYLTPTPKSGDIVVLASTNNSNNEFIVIGIMKSGGDIE